MSADIKQVYDTNPITTTIPDTALSYYGLSPFDDTDDAAATWAVVKANIAAQLGGTLSSVYVDGNSGNDTTGNGSAINPYKSVGHALSVITDATALKRYTIHVNGQTLEVDPLVLKPFISINGDTFIGTTIKVGASGTGAVSFGAGFLNTASSVTFTSFTLQGRLTFDNSASTTNAASCYVDNCLINGAITFTGRSNAGGSDTIVFANTSLNVGPVNLTNVGGISYNSEWAAEFNLTTTSANRFWYSQADYFSGGEITLTTSAGHLLYLQAVGVQIVGGVTVNGTGAQYQFDPCSYPLSGISLATGGTATGTNTIQDTPIGSVTPSTGTFTTVTATAVNTGTIAATGLITATGAGIKSWRPFGPNTYTGTTYTFALTDQDTFIQANNGSAQDFTVPVNASVAFPIGTEIDLQSIGTGLLSIVAAGGVTIISKSGLLTLSAQYSAATLKKVATNTWTLIGDLSTGSPMAGLFSSLTATALITATASGSQSWRIFGTNTYTGATYTFALTDQDTFVQFNRATAQTVTIPTNASVAFPIGTEIDVIQIGAGQVTFAAAGGVTLNSFGGLLSLSGQWSAATLKKVDTDTWDLVGNLQPVVSYPATTTINQLLYSSASNIVSGLATVNNGVLTTNSSGVPSISQTLVLPNQPAFFAYLAATANNKTGNGTSYTLGTDALTELYDLGSNFNTNGTFTAPITGIYDLRTQITITGTTVVTALTIVVSIVVAGTSAKTYQQKFTRIGIAADQSVELSILAKMTATDTATTTIVVTGEAGDTDDILGQANPITFFTGKLAC